MTFNWARSNFAASQSRECRWQALSVGLVTHHTVFLVHGFTVGKQIFLGPLFISTGCGYGQFLLFRGQPLLVFVFRHGLHHDGHKAMMDAAQFSALTTINAGFFYIDPCLFDEARYGIVLNAKLWHPPRVD